MERTRIALILAFCGGLLAVAAEPAAAQNSINDQLIGNLNDVLLYAAIPITLLTQAVLFYAIYKFRHNDDPHPTRENRRLEITWTVATAIVLLFVGIASFQVMANPFIEHQQGDAPDDAAVEIEVVAYNYGWDFIYPEEGIESTGEATIPTDTQVYFNVGADEEQNSYIHGFHVPDLGLKQDANPGAVNTVKTEVYEEGEYQGYCSKYCGVGHSNMYFTINAVSEDEYQQWVQEQQQSSEGGAGNESGGGNESGASNESAAGNESGPATEDPAAGGNESGGQ